MNRLFFIAPAFLIACATAEGTPEETEAALAASGPTITILSGLEGKQIALYAVRGDSEGNTTYIGSAIRSATVVDGEATITLPARAARRDKDAENPTAPVSYIAVAHENGSDGTPETYVGVSNESIAYYTGRSGDGKSGWYVVSTDEEGEVSFARTDREITVDQGISPKRNSELAGTRGKLPPGSMVALVTDTGPLADTFGGFQEDGSFRLVVSGEPAETQELEDGARYQVMNAVAFGDDDLDGKWGPEEFEVGDVCFGLNEIFVTWRESAQSVEQALLYARLGVKTGWQVHARTEEGSFPMGAAELKAQESCTSVINDEPESQEVAGQ